MVSAARWPSGRRCWVRWPILSLIVGNVGRDGADELKRMLAYSTISNVGFIVLGFVAGTPSGYTAALYYTLVYVLVVLGSFGVILLVSRDGYRGGSSSMTTRACTSAIRSSPWS